MYRYAAPIVALCLFTPAGSGAQSPAKTPRGVTFTAAIPPGELVQIDGSKSPELIPQWSAWGFVFRLVANGPGTLPTPVHEVVSREETSLVVREAQAVVRTDAECQERIVKLHALLGTMSNAALDAQLRDITLECRRATLAARDRVLTALNADGAAALRAFVESTKAGTSLSIPKKDLARFLEPE